MNINQLLSLLSINVIGSFVLFLVFLIQWIRQRNKKSTSSDITILEAEDGRVKITQVIKDKGTLILSIAFLIATGFFVRSEHIKQVSSHNLEVINAAVSSLSNKNLTATKRIFNMESELDMKVLNIQVTREYKNWKKSISNPSITNLQQESILIALRKVYVPATRSSDIDTKKRLEELYLGFYESYYGVGFNLTGLEIILKRAGAAGLGD